MLARKRIYIHHVSVQAGARRHGIASALLRQVEAEALIGGITTITLDTWAANGSARSFFEACGFAAFNLSLCKRLT
jgi:ribosomal protein S18 acetylase RimI-like enzyme